MRHGAMSLVIAVSGACALAGPAALAMQRLGGGALAGPPAVRGHDVSDPAAPVLRQRTEDLALPGPIALVHDRLFVAAGSEVRVYEGRALAKPPVAIWQAGAPVLSLAPGTEPGLVLVLDAASLRLVRFSNAENARVHWRLPVDQSRLEGTVGRLVVRDGSQAFVADASLPGVRLISIDPESGPHSLAVYESLEGPVHDISLWDRRLSLLAGTSLVLVDAGEAVAPRLRWLGGWSAPARPSSTELTSRRAFVSLGNELVALDADPSSRNFLAAPVDSWTAPSAVRSIRLGAPDRAWLMLDGSYELLDLTALARR